MGLSTDCIQCAWADATCINDNGASSRSNSPIYSRTWAWLNELEMMFVDPHFKDLFVQLCLTDERAIEDHFAGPTRPFKTRNLVIRTTLPGAAGAHLDVYYKQYNYPEASWEFWNRKSKARCEYHNYEVFTEMGIAAAQRVACGENRDFLGRLKSAFIITVAIPGAMTMTEFLKKHCPDRSSAEACALRDAILGELAEMTRRMHQAKFFHNDLVWRNILVTWEPPNDPKMWWIDCPRGCFNRWPMLGRRRQLKDLALLDLTASERCTVRERLKFMLRYLAETHLTTEARQMIHDALEYRRKRWPSDWAVQQSRLKTTTR